MKNKIAQELISSYIKEQQGEIERFNTKITVAELSAFAFYLHEHFTEVKAFKMTEKKTNNIFMSNSLVITYYDENDAEFASFDLLDEATWDNDNSRIAILFSGSIDFLKHDVTLPNLSNWQIKLGVEMLMGRWGFDPADEHKNTTKCN